MPSNIEMMNKSLSRDRQNTSQYSTETKAEVIEDARQGKTSIQISQERGLPASTARQWIRIAKQLAIAEDRDPRLVDGEYRLAYMGQMIQEAQLEELAGKIDKGESVLHYIIPVNALKGTSIDKVSKQNAAVQVNLQFNYVKRE